MKTIPDKSIDLILTDPPYNIAQYSTGNIALPGREALNNDIAEWDTVDLNPKDFLEDFKRILKPTGNIFIFTSYNQIGKWHEVFDSEFDTFQFFIWHKTNPAPKIYKNGFLNSCEMIICLWNKGHTWNFGKQNEMHNFFECPICMRPERLSNPKHPAQKPVKLLKHIIEIATNVNEVIFDPFMGVGSTGVAALELGRKFGGCEIDETYFNATELRIKNFEKRVSNEQL
ncbi:MAG: site-specific DNA-methyltransferase [Oscillospiraceae bacterium]